MAQKLDEKELVSFKEMLMANSIQVDAVAQLLIEKGIVTEEEF
jgi:beta-N-acetylglucosaminidase